MNVERLRAYLIHSYVSTRSNAILKPCITPWIRPMLDLNPQQQIKREFPTEMCSHFSLSRPHYRRFHSVDLIVFCDLHQKSPTFSTIIWDEPRNTTFFMPMLAHIHTYLEMCMEVNTSSRRQSLRQLIMTHIQTLFREYFRNQQKIHSVLILFASLFFRPLILCLLASIFRLEKISKRKFNEIPGPLFRNSRNGPKKAQR